MNAKTLITVLIVNAIIIAIVIGTFQVNSKDAVIPDAVKPDAVAEKNYITDSVRIVMDQNLPYATIMEDIKTGLSYFNPYDVQRFNEDGWRFIISKELDFTDSVYAKLSDADKAKIESFTNTKTKIIYIKSSDTDTDYITLKTILGMCAFIDYINSFVSSTPEFTDVIVAYPEYREYKYADVEVTDANREKVKLPLASATDYFAYTMRDYFLYPNYQIEKYPEIYRYFEDFYPRQKEIEE